MIFEEHTRQIHILMSYLSTLFYTWIWISNPNIRFSMIQTSQAEKYTNQN